MPTKDDSLVTVWRAVVKNHLKGEGKHWVAFKNGSIVLVTGTVPTEEVEAKAKELMAADGPVIGGTPHGDFDVFNVHAPTKGWMVTSHSPVIFSYVYPDEGGGNQMVTGLAGRQKRHKDSQELVVIHVEFAS